ncbi:molybdopterin-dependent oxidoreductase [Halorientalis halophila]|uniref:molybdopterin-dependent oxidoreductase n=1 Tax=Halorientalis halophila TaxID=3108499 RepID=UPI003008C87D
MSDANATIRVEGRRQLLLPTALDACDGFEPVRSDASMHCDDSGPIDGPWTGLDVGSLLAAADGAPDATHVLLTCRDGYRVCLPVADALSAVLAYRQDGERLGPEGIRVVGPAIGSGRSAQGIARIETATLESGADPTDLERLSPEEPLETA